MRLDLRSPKTFIIFFASFFAGFSSFLLFENAVQSLPGRAIAEPSSAQSKTRQPSEPSGQSPRPISSEAVTANQGETAKVNPGAGQFKPRQGETLESADAAELAAIAQAGDSPSSPPLLDPPETLAGVTPPSTQRPTANRASNAEFSLSNASQPSYEIAWADPSNFGDRFTQDIYNQPATQQPIIVLHETVSSADSAINYFQTPHPNDNDQASYHTLIRRNGVVVYLVPPEKRAYGAGNSVFVGADGREETIKTHKQFSPSVNNFAYHISLESPPDGYGEGPSHSGYSQAQYNSLAWLIGQSTVPLDRITTHQRVDRSGERSDPRSFDFRRLQSALRAYRSF